jgi:ribosome-associated protein
LPPTPSSPNRTRATARRLAPLDIARRCAELAAERRAEQILILDLRSLSTMADFFVIASADADVQLRAAADRIQEGLEGDGEAVWHTEGYESGQWIVLDYVDVVCHLFLKEKRAFYQLEKLWGDAPRLPVAV